MNDNDLNLDFQSAPEEVAPSGDIKGAVFKFDVRTLAVYLKKRWKWILIVFVVSLGLFWGIMEYRSIYSSHAWTATAKVFHQTRSDRIPSFYKPVETNTVMQFLASNDAYARVAGRLKDTYPSFEKWMLSSVEISTDKGRNDIIKISADASTPQMAAAIANAVAEEGISEYVRRQNNSMRIMADERKSQRSEIDSEINALQDEKEKFTSPQSGLSPDAELTAKRAEMSDLRAKKETLVMHLQELDVKITDTEAELKNTPKNFEFETMIDNTSSIGLKAKKHDLENLRMRYTDENPKVKMLMDEIAVLEKDSNAESQAPARVTYRKNDLYSDLETQISSLKLDRSASIAGIKRYDVEIEKRREEIKALLEKNKAFSVLLRRESMLNEKSVKLSDKINDIEFLIGSAVPDVSLMESAKVPSASNIQKTMFKVFALSLGTTFVFAMFLAAVRLGRMKLLSSNEFSLALGIENIGEIPLASEVGADVRMSALQRVSRNLRAMSGGARKVAILKFDEDFALENDIEEIGSIGATKGLKAFRLRCMPISMKPEETEQSASEDDEIAMKLISVVKRADAGVFYYQNNYCLDVAETDILKFDLSILAREYDFISIESSCGEKSAQLGAQLVKLADYAILTAVFDQTSKLVLWETVEEIKSTSDKKTGGILANVAKPYYKA